MNICFNFYFIFYILIRMNKLILSLLVLLVCMQYINAFKYDDLFDDKGGDEDQVDSQEVDNAEASQFLKRLFHPFKTKNEGKILKFISIKKFILIFFYFKEIKRETREVLIIEIIFFF